MTLTRHGIHDQVFTFGCAALGFFMPVHPKVLPSIILIMVLNWLIDGRFIKRIPGLFKNRYRLSILSFASLYLLYVIGLLYSENMAYAKFDLEVKLSLFIFPVLFATSDLTFKKGTQSENRIAVVVYCFLLFVTTWIQRSEYGILFFGIQTWIILFGILFLFTDQFAPSTPARNRIIISFIAGCVIGSLILLIHAATNYLYLDDRGAFYYQPLGWIFHPSYISMYFNFAIAIISLELLDSTKKYTLWGRIGMAVLILYFIILIFLLGSKSGLIILATLSILLVLYQIFIRKKIWMGLVTIVGSVLIFYGGIRFFSYTAERINRSIGDISNQQKLKINSDNSILTRIEIWEDSWEIIRENWLFGVGTGDVKDVLLEKYQKDHFIVAYEGRRNAHEQYLQTFIALGIPGFLILFAMILLPAWSAFRDKYYLYFIFLLIFAINILVESMLESQAGVIFYAFFNVFLFSKKKAILPDDLPESRERIPRG